MFRRSLLWIVCLALVGGPALAATVEGLMYVDLDRDGMRDPGEGPLIVGDDTDDDGGLIDAAATAVRMSVVCDYFPRGNGLAAMTFIGPFDGRLSFDFPFTAEDLRANCVVGLDGEGQLEALRLRRSGAAFVGLEVVPTSIFSDLDFGVIYRDIVASGIIWHDDDGDGVFEPAAGEVGLEGVRVDAECVDNAGTLTEGSGVSGADGSYEVALLRDSDEKVNCTVLVDPLQLVLQGLLPTTVLDRLFRNARAGDLLTAADFGFRAILPDGAVRIEPSVIAQ